MSPWVEVVSNVGSCILPLSAFGSEILCQVDYEDPPLPGGD